jgi:hypothetical protein
MDGKEIIPSEVVESKILSIRGLKVMLDSDLAALYGVETKYLVKALKRNLPRFPADFMFQLDKEEFEYLRFHFGTSRQWGGRRYLPHAFTEQGVAMLSKEKQAGYRKKRKDEGKSAIKLGTKKTSPQPKLRGRRAGDAISGAVDGYILSSVSVSSRINIFGVRRHVAAFSYREASR